MFLTGRHNCCAGSLLKMHCPTTHTNKTDGTIHTGLTCPRGRHTGCVVPGKHGRQPEKLMKTLFCVKLKKLVVPRVILMVYESMLSAASSFGLLPVLENLPFFSSLRKGSSIDVTGLYWTAATHKQLTRASSGFRSLYQEAYPSSQKQNRH